MTQVIRRIDDPVIEIALTTIAAYGSFVLAEDLHVSGVIATVVAGMLCGNYGRRGAMSAMTRAAVESFWEYVAFALNSVVFLLIGLEVSVSSLAPLWREILIAYVAVILARAIIVFGGRAISAAGTARRRRAYARCPGASCSCGRGCAARSHWSSRWRLGLASHTAN